ncbi:MAG: cytidylyltransferase domain-containing protein [Gemmatimonadota bacterium]
MRTLAVVLARGGSKGLPDKNLRLLGGEPLVARPIRHARESGVVDEIVLSTDSERIAEAGRAAGAVVPFMRPADLAGDLATTESGLQHALVEYERISGRIFDACVFLSPADVFRRPEWIRDAVTILRERPEIESVFAGHATHKNFWERRDDGGWERVRDWMAVYSSRQVRRPVVREDTGLACASRSWLWREGRRIGDRVEIIVNDDAFTAIDIHDEEDLRLAEAALRIRGES